MTHKPNDGLLNQKNVTTKFRKKKTIVNVETECGWVTKSICIPNPLLPTT